MKSVLYALVIVSVSAVTYAAQPDAQAVAEGCRAVLEQNLQAVTAEDIDAMWATLSTQTGNRAEMTELRQETEAMFKDADVYMRVAGFQLTKIEPPYAYALVNQLTTPAKDDTDATQGELHYRHHSGLLPAHRLVQYEQKFHFENGKWKVHRITSQPQPADSWSAVELSEVTSVSPRAVGGCANGQCTPFITVR